MNLLTRLCFGLLAAASNFRVVATTTNSQGSLSWRVASTAASFVGGSIFEKVAGVWGLVALPTSSGVPNTAQAAASANGLTLVCTDAATNKNALIFTRASTDVSFSTATVTSISLPGTATVNGVSVSADGARIVFGKPFDTGGGPSGQHGRVITLVFTSSWQVSSFVGLANQQLGDNVWLSPNGTRLLARANVDDSANVYVYSGFPTLPWEETNTGIANMRWVHWFSDTDCAIASSASGGSVGYWSRNPSSTELVFRWSSTLATLGFADAGACLGGSDAVVWVRPSTGGIAVVRFGSSAFELAGTIPITLTVGLVSRDLRALLGITGTGPFTYTLYEQ